MKMSRLGLILLLATPLLEAAPPAFEANYVVSVKGVNMGVMQTRLSYGDKTYVYQKLTKANGLAALLSGDTLTERSNGQKQGENLIPQHYLYHHKNNRKDRKDEFHFNAPTAIKGKYQQDSYQLTVPTGTIDSALMELRLMEDMPKGAELSYKIASKGKLNHYRIARQGKETVTVPAGEYEAEKLAVLHEGDKRQTIIWMAPALNYAIVKIRHQEPDGDIIESRLKNHRFN